MPVQKITCDGDARNCVWLTKRAPIAQLDRASDYGSEGSRFNSWWVHHSQSITYIGFSF